MTLITKKAAAAELGIGVRSLERLIADGKLAVVKPTPNRVVIETGEIRRFIDAHRVAPVEKISPKQRARFYAQCDFLDRAAKAKPGTSKATMKAWAVERFGRNIEAFSVNDLSYDEASDLLDEMRERAEALP